MLLCFAKSLCFLLKIGVSLYVSLYTIEEVLVEAMKLMSSSLN